MDEPRRETHVHGSVQGFVQTNQGTVNIDARKQSVTYVLDNGEERSVPFLAPYRPRVPSFIGRSDLLAALKQQLLSGDTGSAAGFTYLPGVGKSALARYLAWDKDVLDYFSDGVLWAGLGLTADVFAILGQWALALGSEPDEVDKLPTVEARKAALRKAIGMRKMLLVVDDAWDAATAQHFLLGGPNCAHLITTRQPQIVHNFPAVEVVVSELSEDDGLALLTEIAPKAVEAEPEETRALVQAVGGLPQALILMGNYLCKESHGGQTRRVRAALSRLREAEERLLLEQRQSSQDQRPSLAADVPLSLLALISISEEALHDEEARRTFHALSIFRPKPSSFSEEAALEVAGAKPETLDKLYDSGLLESIPPDQYALQLVLADYARASLSSEQADELHRRAANYYGGKLRGYDNEHPEVNSYQRWYRYEDPDWQELKIAWLYHLSRAQDRTSALLAFARVYFDAFWWWGWYCEFPYCNRLLSACARTQTRDEDQEWVHALQQFHQSYPAGYGRQDPGRWDLVEEALCKLRALAGLDGDIGDLADENSRHLQAITNLLLAHSYQYQNVYDLRADECYREAHALFSNIPEDDWNIPWILYEHGDLYRRRGELDRTLDNCRAALALARSASSDIMGQDCEVIANAHRVLADVYRQQGHFDLALGHYARAAFYAYATQGINGPDPYTRAFYKEITDRTAAWLQSLCASDRLGEALQASASLRTFWTLAGLPTIEGLETLLTQGRTEELVIYLFPAPPSDDDLKAPETYRARTRRLVTQMAGQVEQGS